jgi:small subunit ribosomal protein S21
MQAVARAARGLAAAAAAARPSAMEAWHRGQVQQARGIVVQVRDGNLERALSVMERKMRSSGMERLIRARTTHHVKDSEKRVLARKALMQRVRSQELGKKLREILIKKIRSGPPSLLHQYLYLLAHRFCVLVLAISCWLIC